MTEAKQDAPHGGGVHTSESADSRRSTFAARLRWLLVVGLLFANTVWFTMGLVAAAFGGSLTDWGSGAGGLGGWPDLSQTIFSILVGLAAAIATLRAGRRIRVAVVVFSTGLLIGTAYLVGAHLADPCDRGWWDFETTLGGARLCSSQGEIAQRFHLLLHGIAGVVAAAIAATLYRRTRLIDWSPQQTPEAGQQTAGHEPLPQ